MLEKDLRDLLEKVLREHYDTNIIIDKIDQKQSIKPGNSPMSAPFTVVVQGKTGTGEPFRSSLFLKNAPDVTVLCKNLMVSQAFKKESFAYSKIFSQIPDAKKYIPKVYFCGEDMIIMENLGEAGFKMEDKRTGFTFAQAELVMKAIGTIHAGTFYLRLSKGESEFDEQFSDEQQPEVLKNKSIFISRVLEKQLQNVIEHFVQIKDPTLEVAIDKIEKLKTTENLGNYFLDLSTPDKITVLLHGDLWTDNIMFRYFNGTVDSVKFVDFQGLRLGSPAVDIWTFLYTSISVELLNEHCESLISSYCLSFINTLESSNTTNIPSIEDVQKEIYSKELYGLSVVLTYVAIICMDQKGVQDLYRTLGNMDAILQHKSEINPAFNDRLVGVLKRLIVRNLL